MNARKQMECQKLVDKLHGRPVFYGDEVMFLQAGIYLKNSNIVLTLFDNENGPFSNITVNIEDLPVDEFAVDVNNFPQALRVLKENRIAKPTGKQVRSGFCMYPIWKLTIDEFLKEV